MRDYGENVAAVWGGDPECKHQWGDLQKTITETWKKNVPHNRVGDYPNPRQEGCLEKSESESSFCVLCGAWKGQLGLEPHPQMYIDHMVLICRELWRVLKKTGTFWLNMGDTYCGGGVHHGKWKESGKHRLQKGQDYMSETEPQASVNLEMNGAWLQPKQKLMMPARLAIALQDDGWILRNTLIWFKPNHMPSSVKDRLTNAYEYVFLFVKSNTTQFWTDQFTGELVDKKPRQYYVHDLTGQIRYKRPNKKNLEDKDWFDEDENPLFDFAWHGHCYWFDLDAIRKPSVTGKLRTDRITTKKSGTQNSPISGRAKEFNEKGFFEMSNNPLGKNPGDVWKIPAKEWGDQTKTKEKIQTGFSLGAYYKQNPEQLKYLEHPKGKNPSDVWCIPTYPFPEAHFATFPPKLIEPMIKAGCPEWICPRCGKPRTRKTKTKYLSKLQVQDKKGIDKHAVRSSIKRFGNGISVETVGFSDCHCNAGFEGGIVLDPFVGSGTTCLMAHKLNRQWIGIDLSPTYCEMARQRIMKACSQKLWNWISPETTENLEVEQT